VALALALVMTVMKKYRRVAMKEFTSISKSLLSAHFRSCVEFLIFLFLGLPNPNVQILLNALGLLSILNSEPDICSSNSNPIDFRSQMPSCPTPSSGSTPNQANNANITRFIFPSSSPFAHRPSYLLPDYFLAIPKFVLAFLLSFVSVSLSSPFPPFLFFLLPAPDRFALLADVGVA
jgi:hypothetical protein